MTKTLGNRIRRRLYTNRGLKQIILHLQVIPQQGRKEGLSSVGVGLKGGKFRFRQWLFRATALVGELCLNELSVSFKRPVKKPLHQVEGEVGSSRVHFRPRLDLWRLYRSRWLLTFTFKHSAASPSDWHLHKCYRDHMQIRLGFEMDQLGLTSWFNRDILLHLPSVCCGGCFGNSRTQKTTNIFLAQA